jgi:hypothetical protein
MALAKIRRRVTQTLKPEEGTIIKQKRDQTKPAPFTNLLLSLFMCKRAIAFYTQAFLMYGVH